MRFRLSVRHVYCTWWTKCKRLKPTSQFHATLFHLHVHIIQPWIAFANEVTGLIKEIFQTCNYDGNPWSYCPCQSTQCSGKSNKGLPWWESVPIKRTRTVEWPNVFGQEHILKMRNCISLKIFRRCAQSLQSGIFDIRTSAMHPSESVTVAIWLMHLYWIKREQK